MEERLKEILCQQMELLAEASEKCNDIAHYDTLVNLSEGMSKLCSAYQQIEVLKRKRADETLQQLAIALDELNP